jgi:hypothetical protein
MQEKGFDCRLWNEDMTAYRNFLHIIFSLRAGGEVLKDFAELPLLLEKVKEAKKVQSNTNTKTTTII